MTRSAQILLPVLVLALAGCGNSRTPVPAGQQASPVSGTRMLRYPGAGIAIEAPSSWTVTAGRPPLIATISSGTAVVALWRYPRSARSPAGSHALRHARRALIAAARSRDPELTMIRSRITMVDRAPAIELDALEQIAGHQRRVRSMHVFEPHAEIVLDEFAPVDVFRSVDHTVFSPLKRSLQLTGTAA